MRFESLPPPRDTSDRPKEMADVVSIYQQGADGRWTIEELLSAGDRVEVRWTGSGSHVGEVNGVAATGGPIRADAITIHRMAGQDRRDVGGVGGVGRARPPAVDRGRSEQRLTMVDRRPGAPAACW